MDFEKGIQGEWLVANGLGGYSSSTLIGCNTRKYHGLLVASLEPPVKRRLLLSKLEETIDIEGKIRHLSTNEYVGAVHPQGHLHLTSFDQNPFPTFLYKFRELTVSKKICTVHNQNAVVISYQITNPEGLKIGFNIKPFITSRGIHDINHVFCPQIRFEKNGFTSKTQESFLKIQSQSGAWSTGGSEGQERWYRNIRYRVEDSRGYQSVEDLYSPGEFNLQTTKTCEINILAVGGKIDEADDLRSWSKGVSNQLNNFCEVETKRINGVVEKFREKTGKGKDALDDLVIASDSCIVERNSPRGKSIIAGYHWFTDFGRDAFISLPGLTLVTERFSDAKKILWTYNEAILHGLIPNNFTEDGRPEYHGVDASLWWIYAVQKYLEYTGDQRFVDKLHLSLKAVVEGYLKGNGLASAGEDGLVSVLKTHRPLTWMDVKTPTGHATPRFGKVVEVNALWYNALRFLGELGIDSKKYGSLALKVQSNFIQFWNEDKQCLFDFIYEDLPEGSIRPNQILALSLPYSPLDRKHGKSVVSVVEKELLTPYGLRSLEPGHRDYKPFYRGGALARDLAYHQGTVWSWLIGPYATAYVKVHRRSPKSKLDAKNLLKPLMDQVHNAGFGSVSEVFDGDPPHKPGGCISQAWSVAEILRAYAEDVVEMERPIPST